jgi:hypothetical protein
MVSISHHKIRPASMIDPNPALVRAPAVAFSARSIAMLCRHPHVCASCIHGARMPSHVVGVARNRLCVSVVVPIAVVNAAVMIHVTIRPTLILKDGIPPNREIRSASVIYPNTPFVGAPAITLRASRLAVLCQQAHSASRIKRAGVSLFIVGVAGNRLRIPVVLTVAIVIPIVAVHILINSVLILVVPVFAGCEIRAASVIHPDAIFVSSPAVAFLAGGVAALHHQAHSASYIHRAGMSRHIVGVAGNRGLAQ